MEKFLLSREELLSLRREHRLAKHKRDAYKINVIILLGTGWEINDIKDALLLDDQTIRNYWNRYQEGGVKELIKNHHEGRQCQLSIEEMKILEEELDSKIYLNIKGITIFVENQFGVKYTQSGMRDLLHRMGYEYKKPKLVPGNPDIEAQEVFANQYEAFMEKKPSDIEVLFMDAVHPQYNTMAAYGWIKRGEKRELKTATGRERLNLHGAMNAETYEITLIESQTVSTESTLNLFSQIEQHYPLAKEILIIADNARYHFSKPVRHYLKTSRIKLILLPSYSPNLNLIERLWKFFKKKILYNQYYENLEKFRLACINFFKNIDDVKEELISFIGTDFELA
jgi:transposase